VAYITNVWLYSQKRADDINEYHYGEIRKAVADHYDQKRSGGKDIDVEIDIKKLEIEFEKNFFIAIKKVGIYTHIMCRVYVNAPNLSLATTHIRPLPSASWLRR